VRGWITSEGCPSRHSFKIGLQLVWIFGSTHRNQLLAVDAEVDPVPRLAKPGDRVEYASRQHMAGICGVGRAYLEVWIHLDGGDLDAAAYAVLSI
jgi:hypothetical protein